VAEQFFLADGLLFHVLADGSEQIAERADAAIEVVDSLIALGPGSQERIAGFEVVTGVVIPASAATTALNFGNYIGAGFVDGDRWVTDPGAAFSEPASDA